MKNTKNIVKIVVAIIVIGLCIWGGIALVHHFRGSGIEGETATSTAAIESFTVERPNLVVHSTNLARVEIYAVPTGTNLTEADIQKLGTAQLENTSYDADVSGQVWTFPIPKNPISATDIYAIGYDAGNNPAGSVSLGIVGATNIYNALWGNGEISTSTPPSPTANEYKTLGVGKSATWGGLTVTLVSVDSDSRCPQGSQCVQAGNVTGTLTLSIGGVPAQETFDSSKPLVYQGYTISVDTVSPPSPSQDFSTYSITFRVQES